MDGLVWFGVICTVVGAVLFAFGMRRDPILAVGIPGGTTLLMVVLLYFILADNSPSPAPQAVASDSEDSPNPLTSKSPDEPVPNFIEALQTNPPPTGSQGSVDLLAQIGPRPRAIGPPWSMQGGALVSPRFMSFTPSKMLINHQPPQSFQLTAVVQRLSGQDSINFGFPVGGRDIMVCIDGYGDERAGRVGAISGINRVDGRTADRNDSMRVGPFLVGQGPHTIVCTVGPDSVHVTVNNRVAVDWKGNPGRLAPDPRWLPMRRGHIHLGCWQTSYRITKLEIKPLP
ncbi:MAG: hypothetical protein KDA84_13830 [Planctomycetaceae bacterium]|nr:hypothetical protein [Planctomycetaceae bacterium]